MHSRYISVANSNRGMRSRHIRCQLNKRYELVAHKCCQLKHGCALEAHTVKSISSKQLAWGFSCNIRSRHSERGGKQNRTEEKLIGTTTNITISTTTTTYHHHYLLHLLQSKMWREERREEEPQNFSHTLIQFSTYNLERITSRMQGLKVSIGNIKFCLYYFCMHCLCYHAHGNYWGLVLPSPATAHLAKQTLIWKRLKKQIN